MRIMRCALLFPVAFVGFASWSEAALLPHRAIYELAMGEASDRSGITGINGRMVYEFAGSECDGYTVTFRFVMRIESDEMVQLSDQQTTTFESGDGKTFHFVTRTYLDNELDKEVKGAATLNADGTTVTLDKPSNKTVDLAQAKFPTEHLKELLRKAADGIAFYQTNLFDGSEDADKVMLTAVTVGKPKPVLPQDPERQALDVLANDSFWPVTIAYFDEPDARGEQMPEYDISFLLHESGVTRDLNMDYGDFSIQGKLTGLTLFDDEAAAACEAQ